MSAVVEAVVVVVGGGTQPLSGVVRPRLKDAAGPAPVPLPDPNPELWEQGEQPHSTASPVTAAACAVGRVVVRENDVVMAMEEADEEGRVGRGKESVGGVNSGLSCGVSASASNPPLPGVPWTPFVDSVDAGSTAPGASFVNATVEAERVCGRYSHVRRCRCIGVRLRALSSPPVRRRMVEDAPEKGREQGRSSSALTLL